MRMGVGTGMDGKKNRIDNRNENRNRNRDGDENRNRIERVF